MRAFYKHRRCSMNKISGILPNNARISSVDLRESGPVRPGQPNYGRGEALVTKRGTPKLFVQEVGNAYKQLSQAKLKEKRGAHIADELSNNFFNKQKPVIDKMGPSPVQVLPETVTLPDIGFEQARQELTVQSQNLQKENNKILVAGENLNLKA